MILSVVNALGRVPSMLDGHTASSTEKMAADMTSSGRKVARFSHATRQDGPPPTAVAIPCSSGSLSVLGVLTAMIVTVPWTVTRRRVARECLSL